MSGETPGWLSSQLDTARQILEPIFGRWPSGPVDVVYPDRSPARMSFVEPLAWPTGRPRMRLKADDPRVRGTGGWPAVVVPHELAHVVHFDAMPLQLRLRVEASYATWLAGRLVRGAPPEHHTAGTSSPLVAWLEAFGLLAERYWLFAQEHRRIHRLPGASHQGPQRLVHDLAAAFVHDELSDAPRLAATTPGYVPVCELPPAGTAAAASTEGCVYRDVFLHPGARTSLGLAVADYLDASAGGILNMKDYVNRRRRR